MAPSQQNTFIVMWDGRYFVECCAPFGAASSPGVFGHITDALITLYKAGGWTAVKKWVNDFLFFHYPYIKRGGTPPYSHSRQHLLTHGTIGMALEIIKN